MKRASGAIRHAVRVELVLAATDRGRCCWPSMRAAATELAAALGAGLSTVRRALADPTIEAERRLAIVDRAPFGASLGPGEPVGEPVREPVGSQCAPDAGPETESPQVNGGEPVAHASAPACDAPANLSAPTATAAAAPPPPPPSSPSPTSPPSSLAGDRWRRDAVRLRRQARELRPSNPKPRRTFSPRVSQWCFNGCEVVDAGSGVACRAYPGETIVACASCAIDDPGAAVTRAVAAWLARHEEARDLDAQAAALDALAVLEDDLAVALGDQTATSSTANEEPQP